MFEAKTDQFRIGYTDATGREGWNDRSVVDFIKVSGPSVDDTTVQTMSPDLPALLPFRPTHAAEGFRAESNMAENKGSGLLQN